MLLDWIIINSIISKSLRYIAKVVTQGLCMPMSWNLSKLKIRAACNTNGLETLGVCEQCKENEICRSYVGMKYDLSKWFFNFK